MRIPNSQFLILNSLLLAVLSWSATAQSLPAGPGKEVFESVCSLCHTPTAVFGKQWTRSQWEAKVIEMLQEETDVTAAERTAIVEYLSSNFVPGGKIYVNKAKAKDLETAGGVPNCTGSALCFLRLFVPTRPKLRLRCAKPSESQRSRSRFR